MTEPEVTPTLFALHTVSIIYKTSKLAKIRQYWDKTKCDRYRMSPHTRCTNPELLLHNVQEDLGLYSFLGVISQKNSDSIYKQVYTVYSGSQYAQVSLVLER